MSDQVEVGPAESVLVGVELVLAGKAARDALKLRVIFLNARWEFTKTLSREQVFPDSRDGRKDTDSCLDGLLGHA